MNTPNRRVLGPKIPNCQCGRELPLCEPASDAEARTWICVACGQVIQGVLDDEFRPEYLQSVRPEPITFDRTLLAEAPPELTKYVIKRANAENKMVEKRFAHRHAAIMQVPGQCLDAWLQNVGEPFVCVTRDISTRGLGLMHVRPLTERFLVVELGPASSSETVQILMRIVRCRPHGPFFDLAGEFIAKSMPLPVTAEA